MWTVPKINPACSWEVPLGMVDFFKLLIDTGIHMNRN
jgi:hypothetical protein